MSFFPQLCWFTKLGLLFQSWQTGWQFHLPWDPTKAATLSHNPIRTRCIRYWRSYKKLKISFWVLQFFIYNLIYNRKNKGVNMKDCPFYLLKPKSQFQPPKFCSSPTPSIARHSKGLPEMSQKLKPGLHHGHRDWYESRLQFSHFARV